MKKNLFIVSMVFGALSLTSVFLFFQNHAQATSEVYRNDDHYYTLTLPERWAKIPAEQFTAMADYADRQGISFDYAAGYYRPDLAQEGSIYPYILIQNQTAEFPGYDDIEKAVSGDELDDALGDASKDLSELMSSPNVSDKALDRQHNMYKFKMVTDIESEGRIYAMSYNFFGRSSLIGVYLYDTKDFSAELAADMDFLVENFKFDDDYVYDEEIAKKNNPTLVSGVMQSGFFGAIIGGFIGLAYWFSAMRKKKPSVKR